MKTLNQEIQNLSHHACHVATIGLISLGLVAVMICPALAQTHHSGERSDDFTMMPRNMTALSIERCASGQIAVGSTCVTSSSGSSVLPWTSYFVGQRKCTSNGVGSYYPLCVTINNDGTVYASDGLTSYSYKLPNFNEFMFIDTGTLYCSWVLKATIQPTGITIHNTTPTGWDVIVTDYYTFSRDC